MIIEKKYQKKKYLKNYNLYTFINKMPKANTKTESSKTKQPKKEVTSKVKVVEVVPKEPVILSNVEDDITSTNVEKYAAEFEELYSQLTSMRSSISDMLISAKKLQRSVHKDLKNADKKSKRVNAKKGKREPSGFAKPAVISNELCDFLNQPYGTEMARTEVTKYLTSYIKDNNLQQPEDKRKINPDKKLSKLLKLTKDDQVTYFNLQKYMKSHFPPTASSVGA